MGRIDRHLGALSKSRSNNQLRRDQLAMAGQDLLGFTRAGSELVARLFVSAPDSVDRTDIADLMGAGLFSARLAIESGNMRGRNFVLEAEKALDSAMRRQEVTTDLRLELVRLWNDAGLTPPQCLQIGYQNSDQPLPRLVPPAPGDFDGAFNDALEDLIREDASPMQAYEMFRQVIATMPESVRAALIMSAVTRTEPLFEHLALYWLLDRDDRVRKASLDGLRQRQKSRRLSPSLRHGLALVRNWFPAGAYRDQLDQLLRDAMKSGVEAIAPAPRPVVRKAVASMADGAGAQNMTIAARSGSRCFSAVLLVTIDAGVKDAFVIDHDSARQQTAFLKQIIEESGAQEVPAEFIHQAVAREIAAMQAAGTIPPPGLIDVAREIGTGPWLPKPGPLDEWMLDLERKAGLERATKADLARVQRDAGYWHHPFPQVIYWFAQSDELDDILNRSVSNKEIRDAIWSRLERDRRWWLEILARSAAVVAAAGHPLAPSFVATAAWIRRGFDLRKLEAMKNIHDLTLEFWLENRSGQAETEWDEEDDPVLVETRGKEQPKHSPKPPPVPERDGEYEELLAATGHQGAWLNGFMMATALAPTVIAPSDWLLVILNQQAQSMGLERMERFFELAMRRYNLALQSADSAERIEAGMMTGEPDSTRLWAAGFSNSCKRFASAWRDRKATADDRKMIRLLGSAAKDGLGEAERRLVVRWLAARAKALFG